MKYTVIGDPHITPKNIDKANELFDLVESMNRPVIWLGDFLDTKEVIRGNCLNLLYNRLKSSKLRHIIIVGNHDWFNLECQDHSLEVLKELENVMIIDKPEWYQDMWFMPYMHDKAKIKDELKKIIEYDTEEFPKDPEPILIGHFDISSFDYGNGFLCEDGLDVKDFKDFHLVVSGHFHKYQQKQNVIYLGTPFSHSFGETDQKKFIGILDSETKELTVEESCFPQHRTVTIEYGDHNKISGIEHAKILTFEDHPNDYWRVILSGPQDRIKEMRECVERSAEGIDLKIIEKPTDIDDNSIVIEETMNNSTQFEKWATEIAKIDPEIIKLGMEYLR